MILLAKLCFAGFFCHFSCFKLCIYFICCLKFMAQDIFVPDIGDFDSVEIIEVLVKVGDHVEKDDPLVTLESDKSSVEVPSPAAGKINELNIKVGDKVSKGSLLAKIDNN